MNYTALIPARGASKRIPRKMLKPFKGRPLVSYTIDAALDSKRVGSVIVSTEDDEIKGFVSIGYPQVSLFHRSLESTIEPNVPFIHLKEYFASNGPDAVVMLQATSPFTTGKDIDRAIEQFEGIREKITLTDGAAIDPPVSLFSGVRLERYFYRDGPGETVLSATHETYLREPLSDCRGLVVENGAIYIFRRKDFLRTGRILSGYIAAYEMPIRTFFELDTEEDWRICENCL